MYDKNALKELFRERALKFGDFTLASGKKATYYLDGKQITLHSKGLQLVSEGLLELLRSEEIDAVGGMSIGAEMSSPKTMRDVRFSKMDLRRTLDGSSMCRQCRSASCLTVSKAARTSL